MKQWKQKIEKRIKNELLALAGLCFIVALAVEHRLRQRKTPRD
jgi:hypothetical protein